MMKSMMIDMNEGKLKTLSQVKEFLSGSEEMDFRVVKSERYAFMSRTLSRFRYGDLPRSEKGIVLRFLERLTGLSRQQVTRHIKRFRETGEVSLLYRPPVKGFQKVFQTRDIALLAEMDERHGTLSGPATKKLLERACEVYGDTRYATLSRISVSHLYNLREGKKWWPVARRSVKPIFFRSFRRF